MPEQPPPFASHGNIDKDAALEHQLAAQRARRPAQPLLSLVVLPAAYCLLRRVKQVSA